MGGLLYPRQMDGIDFMQNKRKVTNLFKDINILEKKMGFNKPLEPSLYPSV